MGFDVNIEATPIPGVCVVDTVTSLDTRGAFKRLYCENELSALIGSRRIVQVNLSRTHAVGAVRGLHYQQPPHAEMKLVRCTAGRVWDVAVDLRAGSPTFLHWHAVELSAENARMLVIPEGCAHGFQVMEPDSELLYLHTAPYAPVSEGGVRWDDSAVGVAWPLPVVDISPRDASHRLLAKNFSGIAP